MATDLVKRNGTLNETALAVRLTECDVTKQQLSITEARAAVRCLLKILATETDGGLAVQKTLERIARREARRREGPMGHYP